MSKRHSLNISSSNRASMASTSRRHSTTGAELSVEKVQKKSLWRKIFSRLFRKKKTTMWGIPLEEAIQRKSTLGIPYPVYKLCTVIEATALDVEGLYRVQGSLLKFNDLKERFDKGEDPDMNRFPVNVLAMSVKSYFASLPDPLMTYQLYDNFLMTQSISNAHMKLASIREYVNVLPPKNRVVLQFLMEHLARVAEHSDLNSMTAANLAKVFGPTLFRSVDTSPFKLLNDVPCLIALVYILITEREQIFGELKPPSQQDSSAVAAALPESHTAFSMGRQQLRAESNASSSMSSNDLQKKHQSIVASRRRTGARDRRDISEVAAAIEEQDNIERANQNSDTENNDNNAEPVNVSDSASTSAVFAKQDEKAVDEYTPEMAAFLEPSQSTPNLCRATHTIIENVPSTDKRSSNGSSSDRGLGRQSSLDKIRINLTEALPSATIQHEMHM